MECKVLVICILVGSLGILAAVFGFAAEATRIKQSDIRYDSIRGCTWPSSPASELGLTSFVLLLISQITVTISAKRFCCTTYYTSKSLKYLSGISWIAFLIASSMILRTAGTNKIHEQREVGSRVYCSYTRPWFFLGGAVLSLVSSSFGIIYYLVSLSSSPSNMNDNNNNNKNDQPNHGDIPLGQPVNSQPQFGV